MKKTIKNILRPITPKYARTLYRRLTTDLDKYHLLPKDELTYATDLLYTFHNADFIKEPLFKEAYDWAKKLDGGHLLSKNDIQWRIHVLCWAASHATHLEGDFIDCGVNTGFCPRAIMHYVGFEKLKKTYYLLDTFSGMDPRYSSAYEMDRHQKLGYGKQVGLYEQVKKTFSGFKNVKIVKGTVPDTLPQVTSEKISFLSIDMNCVAPEIAALEYFWDKIVSGGIIVLDDYGYPGCIEQKEADDAFAKSKGVKILSLPTCQGVIIKP